MNPTPLQLKALQVIHTMPLGVSSWLLADELWRDALNQNKSRMGSNILTALKKKGLVQEINRRCYKLTDEGAKVLATTETGK